MFGWINFLTEEAAVSSILEFQPPALQGFSLPVSKLAEESRSPKRCSLIER